MGRKDFLFAVKMQFPTVASQANFFLKDREKNVVVEMLCMPDWKGVIVSQEHVATFDLKKEDRIIFARNGHRMIVFRQWKQYSRVLAILDFPAIATLTTFDILINNSRHVIVDEIQTGKPIRVPRFIDLLSNQGLIALPFKLFHQEKEPDCRDQQARITMSFECGQEYLGLRERDDSDKCNQFF